MAKKKKAVKKKVVTKKKKPVKRKPPAKKKSATESSEPSAVMVPTQTFTDGYNENDEGFDKSLNGSINDEFDDEDGF